MNVAIVGCGVIGQKRAANLPAHCRLLICVDQLQEKAQALAQNFHGCEAYTDWQIILERDDIDIVIIATIHACLAEIATGAVKAGKHVLIEKPGAKHSRELEA